MEGRPGGGQIGILGPVELTGEEPVPLDGVKEGCLLAALAVHCGEAVSVASLVDALWGDDPPRTATKTLQNYVLRVRRALAQAKGAMIATLPDGYCLRTAPDATDAGRAERLIAKGRRETASGDPAAAARLLRQALDLWRGPALGEFADRPFAAAEAMRLEELRETALEDLFDAELTLGHHHEMIGGLEALVTSGPLRERQLADAARAGLAVVLAGRCAEGGWTPPFRPFAEAITGYGELVSPRQLRADFGLAGPALARMAPRLCELLPELTQPPALQPDEEQFRLLDAAAQFFTAVSARAAVLLILDDLQWADAGTAMMLRHVARGCGHRRLLLAGAYRTTEAATPDLLADVLGALQAETDCSVIRLRALEEDAIGQLVSAEARAPVSSSLARALRFDEAVKTARDAAERIAQADGPHAAATYLAGVTSALSTAGSSAHAWMLAPAGLRRLDA